MLFLIVSPIVIDVIDVLFLIGSVSQLLRPCDCRNVVLHNRIDFELDMPGGVIFTMPNPRWQGKGA
jgi:hypothetical protein